MRRSYLGKLQLQWCDTCHVPVLGTQCACGGTTRAVAVTPPGDIRPAFDADIDHINTIFTEHFGKPLIPEGHIALLNKIPDTDRMEEIILGGSVVSAIRYLPGREEWEPIPRLSAMKYTKPTKRFVVVDDGAVDSIRKGASVLAPGLITIDAMVEEGDEVCILDRSGNCIGVGRAKVSAQAAEGMERGVVVRTRKNAGGECIPGCATWNDAIEANKAILQKKENEAIRFIRNVAEKNPIPVNVSYSGGKDSLATLLVVMKALGPVPLIFADTGLEFDETYENIEEVASYYGLDLIRTGMKESFWDIAEREGPPAVDARWCCKECKLIPVKNLIRDRWGECLSFIGQRKYESFIRKNSPRVWRNSHVKNQLSAAPLQHWTALHVWLYLFREKAPYNRLYEHRIDRIGCFMCPSSDMAIFETIKEDYPELWSAWMTYLNEWKEKHNLSSDWINKSLWRRRGDLFDENSRDT